MSDKKYNILLVEDEESLAIGLEYNLKEEGFDVTIAKDGREAARLFEKGSFDLVILDIMLPYLNGFEVAKIIRSKSSQMPILMLTAKSNVVDKIKGLQIGADDYLTKPFHLGELLLRIKGMLKRKEWYSSSVEEKPVYKFKGNEIDFDNLYCKTVNGEFQLTHHEAMLLKYMIDRKGKPVSRDELLKNVWHIDADVETRTIDNFIVRFRKYFEKDPSSPEHFKSVRGIGYQFND
ncbi:MAG: response regulator transcription factor [Melioribacteraceae bacterium]|nr:response regulator transcription factor [Melioribacteraceae bacterium]MCF8395423.1 response regulator transcription factor [Melioribacteraceae bacterium]MCF8420757.1 response regulator transcription factor [Melioribacteraceae bacterium]